MVPHRRLELDVRAATDDGSNLGAFDDVHRVVRRIEAGVVGRHLFEAPWKVHPELEPAVGAVPTGHFGVIGAAPGSEPLRAPRTDSAVVPEIVDVVKRPFDHVRERFEPAMRVRRKARRWGDVEIVEKHERIEVLEIRRRKEAVEPRTLAVRSCERADPWDFDERRLACGSRLPR